MYYIPACNQTVLIFFILVDNEVFYKHCIQKQNNNNISTKTETFFQKDEYSVYKKLSENYKKYEIKNVNYLIYSLETPNRLSIKDLVSSDGNRA